VHRTIVGDNLASIAYAEYGDPAHWRPLAAYNGIDDPLRLPNGRTILLPSLEEMGVTR
jgi:nucleoid-associated protein YgaU